ncbi:hypothetical protein ABZ725_29800 [Streptomyces sp. NPDC006872]|uniref:hypothetical protein n=1 Tax=Streptomyces sp. NPDC006872 TaxID=3155720 RepID=UPI0033ED405F
MPEKESAAQQAIGSVAPKLADLTDQVLFGDVWEREGFAVLGRCEYPLANGKALVRQDFRTTPYP